MATNDEIIKKHSTNPNAAVEQMDCSLDTLMDEARADQLRRDTDKRVQSIRDAHADAFRQIDTLLEEMEKRANFFFTDAADLANKGYERGFFDGIHNARAKIKGIMQKVD